ncbi:NRDE family protein [Microbacterium neungamense]|uniref:NRDE family protein n=1 Tax=Microbacterium neungamense TaxID=2810535 RepID=UPI00217E5249|nr:NRDE family protein [Microbacterium neungamense]UWF77417.1 NRDE family protein [Microbacterium neungamense]
MCTVVIDVSRPTRLLAVRDEDPQREWDDLGVWWPEHHPGVIGIRDRRAGGAWLAVDPASRRLAVLLNRADVLDLPESEVLSRGSLALESVAGRSPEPPLRTHGFNLLEVSPERSRVLSWDGVQLSETPVPEGVHMIAHDGLDDPTTARIATWLPRFRADRPAPGDADWSSRWLELLAESGRLSRDDDRAIIRDNHVHGYPTMSLLYCIAAVADAGAHVHSHVLARPGEWS